MALLSVIIAIILILQLTIDLSYRTRIIFNIIDFLIWVIFTIDYLNRLYNSENKVKFFKRNLIDIISIIPMYQIFHIFRALNFLKLGKITRLTELSQLIRVLAIIRRSNKNLYQFMRTNNFNYTAGIAIIIIFSSAIIMSAIEKMNLGDAFWWSIVTFTTVGYGDIYPHSIFGKIIASILMIMGIGFIGSLTSTFSTYFINKEEQIRRENTLKDVELKSIKDKDELVYIKNESKEKIIKDIVNRILNFDDLSIEELDSICSILYLLKK